MLAQQPLPDKKCTTTINASLDGRQVDPQNLSILSACQSESSAAKRRKKTLQFSQKFYSDQKVSLVTTGDGPSQLIEKRQKNKN